MQHQLVINGKTENIYFLSYPILCPLCHIHQRKQVKKKFKQCRIYFNVAVQVHIVREKKTSTKLGHLISQFHNTKVRQSVKPCIFRRKIIRKASGQKLLEWTMKNSNVCESPISHDTIIMINRRWCYNYQELHVDIVTTV